MSATLPTFATRSHASLPGTDELAVTGRLHGYYSVSPEPWRASLGTTPSPAELPTGLSLQAGRHPPQALQPRQPAALDRPAEAHPSGSLLKLRVGGATPRLPLQATWRRKGAA